MYKQRRKKTRSRTELVFTVGEYSNHKLYHFFVAVQLWTSNWRVG